MALLVLVDCQPDVQRDSIIRILNYTHHKDGDYVTYTIQVAINDVKWTVERRYSQFAQFNRRRFDKMIGKKNSFLPPKKLLGNKEEEFLAERRIELEKYLRTTFELEVWLARKKFHAALPIDLAQFLDFHVYVMLLVNTPRTGKWEIYQITARFSKQTQKLGEQIAA